MLRDAGAGGLEKRAKNEPGIVFRVVGSNSIGRAGMEQLRKAKLYQLQALNLSTSA